MKKRFLLLVEVALASILCASSLTLVDLDRALLTDNANIRKANETVNQAYLDVKDAKANLQPSVSLSGSATYMVNPPVGQITMESSEILSQMGLGSYSSQASGYVTLYDGMENTLYMGTLSLTQPLLTWGKLEKAIDLYKSAYSAQMFRRDDTVRQAQAELRVRVWSLEYLDEMRDLLLEAQDLSKELVDIVESAYQNGLALRQDYLSAQISAMEVEVKLAELETKRDEVLSGLECLVGKDDLSSASFELEEEDWLRYQDRNVEELCALATSSGSDTISAAQSLIQVYSRQTEIAKRSMYGIPDFALQVSLTYGGSRWPLLEMGYRQKDSYGVNLSVGFSSVLWDGGKLLNNIDRAESNVRDAQATLDSARQQLENAVRTNWKTMDYVLKDLEYHALKLENQENELSVVQANVEFGQQSRSDEIQKELEILGTRGEILEEKIQLVQNVFTLDYLVGVEF